jgi:hypothetical protein
MQAAADALPTPIPGLPNPDGCYPNFTTAEGCNALAVLTGGIGNTAVGWYSLFLAGDASFNTGVGAGALALNNGDSNTAVGAAALLLNVPGTDNTAVGASALLNNFSGAANTAVGSEALLFNDQTGHGAASGNTAVGQRALFNNIDASLNTAVGSVALANNDSTGNALAIKNTAVGAGALFNNTDGASNNAVGQNALGSNTTGSGNQAMGVNALGANTTSSGNVAIGDDALVLYTGPGGAAGGNTAVGGGAFSALLTGILNTALGIGAGSALTGAETNNIYIGDTGAAGDANLIAIGQLAATGIPYTACIIGSGVTVTVIPGALIPDAAASTDLGIDPTNGELAPFVSSERFKEDIKPMDKASEAIFALKPVTFRYKKDFDASGVPQLGLVAEDVAKVNPSLVALDRDGKPFSVNYRPVTAMLLNEFLKEHRKVEKLEATLAQQQRDFQAAVAELKGQIQKVSAQLELNKPAPQTVLNNR